MEKDATAMQAERLRKWSQLLLLEERAQEVLGRIFVRRYRLLKGSDWVAGSLPAKDFFRRREGKAVYKEPSFQKQRNALLTGKVEAWDISLMALVLLGADWSALPYQQQLKKEAEIIKTIRKARNDKAHMARPTQATEEQLDRLWKALKEALVALGEDEDQLTRGVASVLQGEPRQTECSEEMLQKAKQLREQANKLHQSRRFDEAVKLYTDALNLGPLPKDMQAILHSNRSASHHGAGNNAEALQDGKEAIQLNPIFPKGYFRKGVALMAMQKFQKASKAFEWGLALDPTSKEFIQRIAECKEEMEKLERREHWNAEYLPKSKEYIDKEITKRFGSVDYDPKSYVEMFKRMGEHGRAYTTEAHMYMMEDNLNYAEAARLFQLGVDHGSPEAMYNLSLLYLEGRGVEKDLETCRKLLEQAITHGPTDRITGQRNLGVAEAQHSLGKAYLTGLFGEISEEKGLQLIRRSADAGLPAGLNSLGAIYEGGKYVVKDERQAHEYYLAAAAGGDTIAMCNLAAQYVRGIPGMPQDMDKAKMWAERSYKRGNKGAFELLSHIASTQSERAASEQRRQELLDMCPNPESRRDLERMLSDVDELVKIGSRPRSSTTVSQDPKELIKLARTSRTAATMLTAQVGMNSAMNKLECAKNFEEISDAITELSEVYKMIDNLPRFPPDVRDRLVGALSRVLDSQPQHEGARLVWGALHFRDSGSSAYLDRCSLDFPDNWYFPKLRGSRLAEDGKWREAEREYSRALQLHPADLDTLYSLAAVQRNIDGRTNVMKRKTIELYTQFLKSCPPDHPKAPEAHYGVAILYMELENTSEAQKHYELGRKAEAMQLPMFLPYTSGVRDCLDLLFTRGAASSAVVPASGGVSKGDVLDVLRAQIRQSHRRFVLEARKIKQGSHVTTTTSSLNKTQRDSPARQPIALQDMDSTEDKIYTGYLLEGMIIEEAVSMVGLQTVLQDKQGKVERLALYNLPELPESNRVKQKIIIGQRLAISNPYMRMASDGRPMIRVDDPSSVQLLEKENICHFCTKPSSHLLVCGKCKKAQYCSKSCQTQDWKTLLHSNLCQL